MICPQCGGLTSNWMMKDGVCGMCAASNKIAEASGEIKPTGNLLGYYRRPTGLAKKGESCLENGKPMWSYLKWTEPVNLANVIDNIEKWHTNVMEYAVVRCVTCGVYHGQFDWDGVRCDKCAKATVDGGNAVGYELKKGPKPIKLKPILLPKKEEAVPMKNGEVRRLPKANSPMWTTQWAAQGTAKTPYIVSKKDTVNGSTTSEGWACSCGNFTTSTPRADCKHICWVKKFENIPMASPVALLPKEQQDAFKKFLLEQAQKGTPAMKADKPKPFVTQGRRFR